MYGNRKSNITVSFCLWIKIVVVLERGWNSLAFGLTTFTQENWGPRSQSKQLSLWGRGGPAIAYHSNSTIFFSIHSSSIIVKISLCFFVCLSVASDIINHPCASNFVVIFYCPKIVRGCQEESYQAGIAAGVVPPLASEFPAFDWWLKSTLYLRHYLRPHFRRKLFLTMTS